MKKEMLSPSGGVAGNENKMRKRKVSSPGNNSGRRRGRRGGMSMEGSRCSRVNGRGWRCSQQTMVGYALCEHHLGKGKVQNMTNVRSRSKINVTEASGKEDEKQEAMHHPTGCNPEEPLLPSGLKEGNTVMYDNEEADDEEEDDYVARGKKKARSMRSLLEQSPNNSNHSGVAVTSPVAEGRDL